MIQPKTTEEQNNEKVIRALYSDESLIEVSIDRTKTGGFYE